MKAMSKLHGKEDIQDPLRPPAELQTRILLDIIIMATAASHFTWQPCRLAQDQTKVMLQALSMADKDWEHKYFKHSLHLVLCIQCTVKLSNFSSMARQAWSPAATCTAVFAVLVLIVLLQGKLRGTSNSVMQTHLPALAVLPTLWM